jgi:hypothetical protein
MFPEAGIYPAAFIQMTLAYRHLFYSRLTSPVRRTAVPVNTRTAYETPCFSYFHDPEADVSSNFYL